MKPDVSKLTLRKMSKYLVSLLVVALLCSATFCQEMCGVHHSGPSIRCSGKRPREDVCRRSDHRWTFKRGNCEKLPIACYSVLMMDNAFFSKSECERACKQGYSW
ncbi:hypothetical protein MAR_000169 [Mya arenaria]|uniref:Uncharacterized protein n=1 Tax=Mya arenaria TaxID=6604 RepID=A0ABY7FBI3_MYAAR|nr:hypothetical protein MAR_000169 [Mya arenaria]